MRITRLSPFIFALTLTACDTDCPDQDSAVDDVISEDDCVPYDPVTESWELTGQLTGDDQTIVFPVASRGVRGAGILTAELTWDWAGYDGFPRLEIANANQSIKGIDSYGSEQPSLTVETTLFAGDTIDLLVGEFARDNVNDAYPIDFTISMTWSDRMDCFEQNNTQDAASRIVADVDYEAYNLSTFEDTDPSAFDDSSSDDFYTITAPADVRQMIVEISNPSVDSSVQALLMDAGEDPYYADDLNYIGGESGPSKTLEIPVIPGASYDLLVTRWEGPIFAYWARPTEDGSARPDHWDTPYTFSVTFQ
ncbi:MAG: hypothetical protein AAFV53_19170 [Myxococcota bacterium]